MIPTPDGVMLERASNERAARGPGFTFHCAVCRLRKGMVGRKRVGGKWVCPVCAQK